MYLGLYNKIKNILSHLVRWTLTSQSGSCSSPRCCMTSETTNTPFPPPSHSTGTTPRPPWVRWRDHCPLVCCIRPITRYFDLYSYFYYSIWSKITNKFLLTIKLTNLYYVHWNETENITNYFFMIFISLKLSIFNMMKGPFYIVILDLKKENLTVMLTMLYLLWSRGNFIWTLTVIVKSRLC